MCARRTSPTDSRQRDATVPVTLGQAVHQSGADPLDLVGHVATLGNTVPHPHTHLIPRYRQDPAVAFDLVAHYEIVQLVIAAAPSGSTQAPMGWRSPDSC